MTADDTSARLNQIIADYLYRLETGEAPDREALIQAHPNLAFELRSFFSQHDHLKRAWKGEEDTLPPDHAMSAAARPAHQPGDSHAKAGETDIDATLPPAPTPAASEQVGLKVRYFGDYEILEEIARGGMGVVYKARQTKLNRIVALKMILAGTLAGDEDVVRFHAEAEAAASLDHPGIVPIYEVGEHEGQHYFSMGYVEGQSLASLVQAAPLPARQAAELTKRIAAAVDYANERGVIHRDLKPGNVLLDAAGQPRVTDFGLAKRTQTNEQLTGTGQILGTPGYMPPEQVSGDRHIGPQADVYALGGILYCLLTQRPPFQSENVMNTLLEVLEAEPEPPHHYNSRVPRDLETICLACLEKRPERRYASASDLAADLQRFLNYEPILARPISPARRVWHRLRHRPWAVSAGLAFVFMAILCLAYWMFLQKRLSEWNNHYLQARLFARNGQATFALDELREAAELQANRNLATTALEALKTSGRSAERVPANYSLLPFAAQTTPASRDGKILVRQGFSEKVGFGIFVQDIDGARLFSRRVSGRAFAALSQQGTLLAVVEQRHGTANAGVYDTRSGDQLLATEFTFSGQPCLAFSPDNRLLVVVGDKLRIVDISSATIIVDVNGPKESTSQVAFAPDSKSLFTVAEFAPTVRQWETKTGKEIAATSFRASSPSSEAAREGQRLGIPAVLHPHTSRLAWADDGGAIRVYDVQTGGMTAELLLPSAATLGLSNMVGLGPMRPAWDKLAFSPNGKYLFATHRHAAETTIWSVRDGQWWLTLPGHATAPLENGKVLMVNTRDPARLYAWNMNAARSELAEHALLGSLRLPVHQHVRVRLTEIVISLLVISAASLQGFFPRYVRIRGRKGRVVPKTLLSGYAVGGAAFLFIGAYFLRRGAIDAVWQDAPLSSVVLSFQLLWFGPVMVWQAVRYRHLMLYAEEVSSKNPFRAAAGSTRLLLTALGPATMAISTVWLERLLATELGALIPAHLSALSAAAPLVLLLFVFSAQSLNLTASARSGDLEMLTTLRRWIASPDRNFILAVTCLLLFLSYASFLGWDGTYALARTGSLGSVLSLRHGIYLIGMFVTAASCARYWRRFREALQAARQPSLPPADDDATCRTFHWAQTTTGFVLSLLFIAMVVVITQHFVARIVAPQLTDLLAGLRSSSAETRASALRTLDTRDGDAEAVWPSLVDALLDDELEVRESAAEILATSDRGVLDEALPHLIRLLQHDVKQTRLRAAEALGRMAKPQDAVLAALRTMASRPDSDEQRAARNSLNMLLRSASGTTPPS